MGLIEKRYHILGWRDKEYWMTAQQLYERVMKDSESDYNWIASSTELYRICTKPGFPMNYAMKIQIAILNCFANLESTRYISEDDAITVQHCYNSLCDMSEKADETRRKYLKAVIENITLSHFKLLEFSHYGPTYHKICDEWKHKKFKEYAWRRELDLQKLRKELHDDFDKTMKTAEAEGLFKEDDEKEDKEWRYFWSSIMKVVDDV